MRELEKILEEIDAHAIEFETFGISDDYISVEWVKEIIRKHMNDNNSCGECSRRKWYQIGYKDGKDDGWISAEERMPEEYGEYLVTIVPSAGYLWEKKNYSKLLGSDGNSQETYLLHRGGRKN